MDTPARRATTVALGISSITALAVASLWLRGRSVEVQYGLFIFHNAPTALVLAWLGRLVTLRRPGNPLGPVLVVIAALAALHCLIAAIADLNLVRWGYEAALTFDHPLVPADMPLGASVPLWIMNWLWLPQVVLLLTVLPALFPDGSLPSRRWRVVLWLAGIGGTVFGLGLVIDGWPTSTWGAGDSPDGVAALLGIGLLLVGIATAGSVAALVVRWRRTDPDQRQPFRVFAAPLAVIAVALVATYPWQWLWIPVGLVSVQVLVLAYALAVARFRAHELEPVLARRTVATGLTLAVAGGIVGAVLVTGIVATRQFDQPVWQWAAVGVVATAAEPIRRWARRTIDRVVFRLRADRAQIVAEIASHGESTTVGDLLAQVVTALHRSTGADRVEAEAAGDVATAGPGRDYRVCRTEPIVSNGNQLGELRLYVDVVGDLAPSAAGVLADVARVAGTALHHRELAAGLDRQLEQVRAAQRRLVEAQDTARRTVERDLHDGAQAQLIAVRLRLGVLEAQAATESAVLASGLHSAGTEVDSAIDSLRTLARGLQPTLLDQSGVAAALRAQVRGLPLPVAISDDGFGRQDRAVESTFYFGCLEAVQNAVRHSAASHVKVELRADGSGLSFVVSDDGRGFDPAGVRSSGLTNVADRMGAAGGSLHVDSAPMRGTRVTGTLPSTT